ncbi:MAG: DUF748 domain-containing protein [Bacteroidia bacterium]
MSKDEAATPSSAKPRKKRRKLRIFVTTLGILIVIRLCLPYIILHFLNQKLATLDGYYGHVDDIDLAIYRGAYVINDIYLNKVDKEKKDTTEFFKTPVIDISVQWHALFEGKIVGEIEFEKPVIQYSMDKTIGKGAEKDSTDLLQLVRDLLPIKINRFAVNNGQIHYVDKTKQPLVDVPLTEVNIEALNLTNESDSTVLLPATITMKSKLYDGNFSLNVKLDPLNKIPTFDMNATLTKTNLTYLNPFFSAYANFDLKAGGMSLYTEFAAKDNKFAGYVKPLITDLDIVQFEKEEGNILQIGWEALIGSVAEIFQNQSKDQLATKLPVEGTFTKPNIGVFEAIWAVIGNAFISALKPSLDNSISISHISTKPEEKKGFIDKLFNNDKDKDKKETRKERRKNRGKGK